jgi:hypothetical protein
MIYFPCMFFNELCSLHAKRSEVDQQPLGGCLTLLRRRGTLDLALDFCYWLYLADTQFTRPKEDIILGPLFVSKGVKS